jgi:hypothetical protein
MWCEQRSLLLLFLVVLFSSFAHTTCMLLLFLVVLFSSFAHTTCMLLLFLVVLFSSVSKGAKQDHQKQQ